MEHWDPNRDTTCGIYLVTKKLELLVCHPTNARKNCWGVPKGLIEHRWENAYDAAVREFREETSLVIDPRDIKRLGSVPYATQAKTLIGFWMMIQDKIPTNSMFCESMVKLDDGTEFPEVDAYRWIPLGMADIALSKPQGELIPELIKQINTTYTVKSIYQN